MVRIIAWILGGLAALVVLLAGLLVAALFLIDWNMFRDEVEELASAALGREVRLQSLDVNPGWSVTRVTIEGLTVANTGWGEAEHLVAVGDGEVAIRHWPLLWGRTELPEVILRKPVLSMEKDREGRVNWDFAGFGEAAGEAAQPEDRTEVPIVGRLVVRDGKMSYRDAIRGLALEGKIATGTGEAAGDDPLELALDGSLEEEPVRLRFSGGSLLKLRESEEPYPVDLELAVGETSLRAQGTVVEPVAMRGFDLTLSLEGPSLSEVFPIFGAPLPPTPPYRLAGTIAHAGAVWRLSGLDGRVGGSDLSGSVALDQSGEKPFLKADLVSQTLQLKDLAGLVGGTPGPASDKADGGDDLFPDQPIAADRLDAMNMDARFEGERVVAQDLPIDRLRFRVQVKDGRAEANPLSMEVAGGTVSGEIALNGREAVPSADADLKFESLDLKPFFEGTELVQEMGGRFFGDVYVLGVGGTLDEMAASARGDGWIGIRDGTISGLLVEAAGLDVVEALSLVIGGDARIALRCGRMDLAAADGTVRVENAVVDTADSLLVAAGQVDLAKETFDLQIEARAKDFSLIDVNAPVRVHGSIDSPSFSIGGLDPLPFFEMGDQKDMDCDALLGGTLRMKPGTDPNGDGSG